MIVNPKGLLLGKTEIFLGGRGRWNDINFQPEKIPAGNPLVRTVSIMTSYKSGACPFFDLLIEGSALVGLTEEETLAVPQFCGVWEKGVNTIGFLSGRRGTELTAQCYCKELCRALNLSIEQVKHSIAFPIQYVPGDKISVSLRGDLNPISALSSAMLSCQGMQNAEIWATIYGQTGTPIAELIQKVESIVATISHEACGFSSSDDATNSFQKGFRLAERARSGSSLPKSGCPLMPKDDFFGEVS